MVPRRATLLLIACASTVALPPVGAQEIPDFDYEHLSFRGFGVDFGYIYPDRVEPTEVYGLRFDLGYAGPGLRIVPSVSYWTSPLEAAEILEFTNRLESLVETQTGNPTVLDLGVIDYTDVAVTVDGHIVWELPLDLLTFGGLGVTAHIIDGAGPAIDDTFVEDLLDSVTAGFNLHLGAEYPLTDSFRMYTTGRYEVLPDLRYFRLQGGFQIMTGPNAPGEGRGS